MNLEGLLLTPLGGTGESGSEGGRRVCTAVEGEAGHEVSLFVLQIAAVRGRQGEAGSVQQAPCGLG